MQNNYSEKQLSYTNGKHIHKYSIWIANLPSQGEHSSIQAGERPVIVLSNNKANYYSPVISVAPISTSYTKMKKNLPTHVLLPSAEETGLDAESVVLCEQVTSLDKKNLICCTGRITTSFLQEAIKAAIRTQLGV